MGFGLLFIGYALAFAFSISAASNGASGETLSAVPYFFSDVIGGLLMTYAFSKLSAYDKKFRYAFAAALSFSAVSVFGAVNRFVLIMGSSFTSKVYEGLAAASIIGLHFTMFYAIISISRSVGLTKIAIKTRRNLIVMILYFTVYTLTSLSSQFLESRFTDAVRYVYLFLTIFQFVWLFMNLVLIGSCVKWIADEGEEQAPAEKSRLKKLYSSWSEKEDRIFTPKERRSDNNKKK